MTSSIHQIPSIALTDRDIVSHAARDSLHRANEYLGNRPIGFNAYSVMQRLVLGTLTDAQLTSLFTYARDAKANMIRIMWPCFSATEMNAYVHASIPSDYVFTDSHFKATFLALSDKVFTEAEKYGIRLIPCLFWSARELCTLNGETYPTALSNSSSKTYRYAMGLAKWFANRYRNRAGLGAYSFGNEWTIDETGVADLTSAQIGAFAAAAAAQVRAKDTRRPTMVDMQPCATLSNPTREQMDDWVQKVLTVCSGVDVVGLHTYVNYTQWMGYAYYHDAAVKPDNTNTLGFEDTATYLSAMNEAVTGAGKVLLVSEFGVPTELEDDTATVKKERIATIVAKYTFGGLWWDLNLLANQASNQAIWYIEPGTTRATNIQSVTKKANASRRQPALRQTQIMTRAGRNRFEPSSMTKFVRSTLGTANFILPEALRGQTFDMMFWLRKDLAATAYERVITLAADANNGLTVLFDSAGGEVYVETRSGGVSGGNTAGCLPAAEVGEKNHYRFRRTLAPNGTYVLEAWLNGVLWDVAPSSAYTPAASGTKCIIGGRSTFGETGVGAMVSIEGLVMADEFDQNDLITHLEGRDPAAVAVSMRQALPGIVYGSQTFYRPEVSDVGALRAANTALMARTTSLETNLQLLQTLVDTHISGDTLHDKLFAYNSVMAAIRSRDFLVETIKSEIRRWGVVTWKPGEKIEVGMAVLPTAYVFGNNPGTMKIHRAITAGITGAVEPTWATADYHIDAANSATTDGTVTWRAYNIIHIDGSKAGNNTGDGSQLNPYGDVRCLDANALKASPSAFASGRAVSLARGTTIGAYQVTNGTGSMARLHVKLPTDDTALFPERRTIMAYGFGDNPVIDGGGNGALRYAVREEPATATVHQGFITYQDFDITAVGGTYPGLGAAGMHFGVNSADLTQCTKLPRYSKLIRVRIKDFMPKTAGLDTDNDIVGLWSAGAGVELFECEVSGSYDDNVWMVGDNIGLLGCRVYGSGQSNKMLPTRNRADEVQLNSSLWNGNGDTPTRGLRVIGNYFEHPNGYKHCLIVNPECTGTNNYSRDYQIRHNVIIGHKGNRGTGQLAMYLSGFIGDVSHNYIYGGHESATDQAVTCFANVRFYNNVVRTRKQSGIGLGTITINSGAVVNDARGSTVFNNTFLGDESPTAGILNWGTGVTVTAYNNLIMGYVTGIQSGFGSKMSHNAYWQCTTNFAGSGTDLGSNVTADPLVYKGAPYSPASPLLRAGRQTGLVVNDDVGRRLRLSGPPTIGAIDYYGNLV